MPTSARCISTSVDLRHLTLSATKGLNPESVGRVTLPFGEGLVGLAAELREPVVIEHAREHAKFRYFPETGEERFESLMAVPLLVRGVPIGVLAVQTRAPRRFPPRDVQSFQTCAQLIAPVVMNARLLAIVDQSEEERERMRDAARRVGHSDARARRRPSRERQTEFRGSPTARGIAIGPIYG